MIRVLLLVLFLAGSASQSFAQTLRHYGVNLDLTGILNRRVGLACEWRKNERSGLEFQLSYTDQNPVPGAHFFHGDWTVAYAKREIHRLVDPSQNDSRYYGSGRPLPEVKYPTISISTVGGRIGYRASYPDNRWRFFIQPSFSVARHNFVHVHDKITTLDIETENWRIAQGLERLVQTTTYYRQTRQMRFQRQWYAGIHYEIGGAYTFRNGLALEARCGLGFNFGGKNPYPQVPYTMNAVHTHASIRAGYFFGRIRN